MSRKDPQNIQHQAEHTRSRRSPIMGYLVILFAAAFLLLLMAYFQQQRQSAEATTDALKQSVSALDSIQSLMDSNLELRSQVNALEQQVKELEEQRLNYEAMYRASETEGAKLNSQIETYRLLFRLDRLYRAQRFQDAAELIRQMEDSYQPSSLSDRSLSGESSEVTPLARYNQIRKQLQEWDYLK